ncbi:hypothetical protein OAX10_02810 [Flavobacteriales bacterium]|jgi:hypothetical protein|nr:hypothetical protein [Flavobacteriales bacterium]MDG1348702.1 hypothetical protein [Flavobacteriales bacterium]
MNFQLHTLPKSLRHTLTVFLLALSFGYFSGLDLLNHTTDFKVAGVEQNVLGNEIDEEADELHFKMSERALQGLIHSHVISLGMLFLILSIIMCFSSYNEGIKYFLMLEPMVSLVVTFGGLWLLWSGVFWMKYIIMISGIMMHLSLVAIILLLLKDLLFHKSYFAK